MSSASDTAGNGDRPAGEPTDGDGRGSGAPGPCLATLSGDLAAFQAYDLCQLLALARATGGLYLRAPGVHGLVHLEEGVVVGARARPNPQRLGRILRAAGEVSEADLGAAVARQIAGDRRSLGAILLDSTPLLPEALARALASQERLALASLLILPAGRFAFRPGPLPGGARGLAAFDLEALLLEALARLDELNAAARP